MDKETNIISDEDFLKEIFTEVSENKESNIVQDDLEKELFGDITEKDTDKKDPEKKSEDNEEGDEEGTQEIEKTDLSEEELEKTSKRFGVKDTINSLIENDIWVDMPIKYNDKEYENITDLISKEKPSKELFDLLALAQKNYKEEVLKSEYIKVGDKESTKVKLVNAILHDIDYTDLLEYNKDIIEPLQKIDFTSIKDGDRVAEAFVKQCLVEIDNYHPDSIDAVVDKLKKEYRLIDKAEEYQKITVDNFNREIERRKLEKQNSIIEERKQLEEDIKSLKQVLKDKNFNDKFSKEMLKLRFSKDEKGKFHYERLIKDKMSDKAFEAKLLHFLLDEEDFIKTATSKVKVETSRNFLELVNVKPKENGSKQSSNSGKTSDVDEEFLKELGL
jgi:hypothetical protein